MATNQHTINEALKNYCAQPYHFEKTKFSSAILELRVLNPVLSCLTGTPARYPVTFSKLP